MTSDNCVNLFSFLVLPEGRGREGGDVKKLKFSKRRTITFVMPLYDGALDRFCHSVDWFGRPISVHRRDSGGIHFQT